MVTQTIHPIRTDADHAEALGRIDALWGAEAGSPVADELEVLVTLVADYEQRHHPVLPPDPIEAIRFRIDQLGLSRRDLEPMLGTRARVSEVLSGKRPLTLTMIRRLRAGLGVPADVLIGIGDRAA